MSETAIGYPFGALKRVVGDVLWEQLAQMPGDVFDRRLRENLEAEAQKLETLVRHKMVPVKSNAERDSLAELGKNVATTISQLEEWRTAKTKPINALLRDVNSAFKKFSEPLEKFKAYAGKSIIAWNEQEGARIRREQEEQLRIAAEAAEKEALAQAKIEAAQTPELRREAMKEADAASAQQTAALAAVPAEPTKHVRTDSGSFIQSEVWDMEVVDETKVPREYLVVDTVKIRKAVTGGVREIAGVNIFQKKQGSFR